MSQENVALIARGYELWNAGRIDEWLCLFDSEVEFRSSGVMPGLRSVYIGRDGIAQLMSELTQAFEDYRAEPIELVPRGEFVGCRVRFRGKGRGSGAPVEMGFHHAFRIRSGAVDRWAGGRTLDEALAAAGLSE